MRGSELLRDTFPPGSLAPWRRYVDESASRVAGACGRLADALDQRTAVAEPVKIDPAPDTRLVDVQVWLTGVGDDLARVARGGPERWPAHRAMAIAGCPATATARLGALAFGGGRQWQTDWTAPLPW